MPAYCIVRPHGFVTEPTSKAYSGATPLAINFSTCTDGHTPTVLIGACIGKSIIIKLPYMF